MSTSKPTQRCVVCGQLYSHQLKLQPQTYLHLACSTCNEDYGTDVGKILEYTKQLAAVPTDDVIPTYNVTGLFNVMRPDVVGNPLQPTRIYKIKGDY